MAKTKRLDAALASKQLKPGAPSRWHDVAEAIGDPDDVARMRELIGSRRPSADVLVAVLRDEYGLTISPSTIQQWRRRGIPA